VRRDIPGSALSEGNPVEWDTFPDYLDSPTAQSVHGHRHHVPHAAVSVLRHGAEGPKYATDYISKRCVGCEGRPPGRGLGFSTAAPPGTATRGNPVPRPFAPEFELAALPGDGRGGHRRLRGPCRPASAAKSPRTSPAHGDRLELAGPPERPSARPITSWFMKLPEVDTGAVVLLCPGSHARGCTCVPQVGNRCFGVLL